MTEAQILTLITDNITTNNNGEITAVKMKTILDELASSNINLERLKLNLTDNSDSFVPSQKAVKTEIDALNSLALKRELVIPISDETTALTTGTAKVTFRMPFAMTLTECRASLTTAGGTSGTTTFDINASGSTILLNKITIDFGDTTSVGATTPPSITTSNLSDNEEITIDIDAVSGAGTEAGGKIILLGNLTV